MMNFDRYRNKISKNGDNIAKAYENTTDRFIENHFHESTSFRQAVVISDFHKVENGKNVDIRVVDIERLGSLKEVLFRPSQKAFEIGTILQFDNKKWLIFDRYNDKKVIVDECTHTLKWKDKSNNINSLSCIASTTDIGSKARQGRYEIEFNKFDVKLPNGQLYIFAELNDKTKSIELNQRFIFNSQVFEVIGIDDNTSIKEYGTNYYGIILIIVKMTTVNEKDDFVNKIAYNEYKSNTTTGGSIW